MPNDQTANPPSPAIAAVILAAGQGTRMRSDRPKVLHAIAGLPMVGHLTATLGALQAEQTVVVVGPEMEAVTQAVAPHPTVLQADRLGTGHAVLQAAEILRGFDGIVLILFGDTPLITAETLTRMVEAVRSGAAVCVLGFRPADPLQYGRVLTDAQGRVDAIREARDATPQELAVDLCNSGVMAVRGDRLFALLDRVNNDNAKGEYYLTDIVGLARGDGDDCVVVEGHADELLGVNSRAELAEAEAIMQARLRQRALEGGATLQDPQTTYFSFDTQVGRDVVIGPNVFFGPGVRVADGVEIRAFCHIEGATIGAGSTIGPFARLRPGAQLDAEAHIGNFVEIKKATVEQGAKVNHLTYIGDARVGAGANVGAGTITCNYDGFFKHHTDIGKGAFIGSNSALVAPVKIGDGAVVGAGSTIAKDVPADALAVTRAKQLELTGWGKRNREIKAAEKAAKDKK